MAGGKSSRFNSDKLTAPFRNGLLIEGALRAVSEIGEVLLVTKFPEKFRHLRKKFKNLSIVPEAFEEFSPICGIVTGLRAASCQEAVFVPGDSPFLSKHVVRALSKEIPPSVLHDGKRIHPLMFKISKFHLPVVEEFLKAGRHRISELHSVLGSKPVPFEPLRVFDYKGRSLINVNRKEDYIEAVCG